MFLPQSHNLVVQCPGKACLQRLPGSNPGCGVMEDEERFKFIPGQHRRRSRNPRHHLLRNVGYVGLASLVAAASVSALHSAPYVREARELSLLAEQYDYCTGYSSVPPSERTTLPCSAKLRSYESKNAILEEKHRMYTAALDAAQWWR